MIARPLSSTVLCALLFLCGMLGGCSDPDKGPVVFYLDGAGWYTSAGSVKQGLRDGGYKGQFSRYGWSAMLGPAHDHLVTAKSKGVAKGLARKIERARRDDPDSEIHVLGLSAGTAVILAALKELDADTCVDHVVLFSPTVSSRHDLTPAMRHVRGRLYATVSRYDGICNALPLNADGGSGSPAGRVGFMLPAKVTTATQEAYARVVNLTWQPDYMAFDWDGGHTSVTNRRMVAAVIAPRILSTQPFPLDRSVGQNSADQAGGADR